MTSSNTSFEQTVLEIIQRLREDFDIIRQTVIKNLSLAEQADIYRRDRIHDILVGRAPTPMKEGAKIFLHIIPLEILSVSINFADQKIRERTKNVFLLSESDGISRLNFDGCFRFNGSRFKKSKPTSYAQFFHNGIIEFCDMTILSLPPEGELPSINADIFEGRIIKSLKDSLNFMKEQSIPLPVMVFLSLLGVNGYIIDVNDAEIIDRDNLLLAGQLVEQWEQKPDYILKPIFDKIWNASGLPGSIFYDPDGNRERRF